MAANILKDQVDQRFKNPITRVAHAKHDSDNNLLHKFAFLMTVPLTSQ